MILFPKNWRNLKIGNKLLQTVCQKVDRKDKQITKQLKLLISKEEHLVGMLKVMNQINNNLS